MKNFKLKYIVVAMALMPLFNSCSKDFIEVQPAGSTFEENYFKSPSEAFANLVSAYDPLGQETGSSYMSRFGMLNCPSDDTYAGGGSSSDVPTWQAWNKFDLSAANGPQGDLWNRNYTGIFRCNFFLINVAKVPGLDASTQKRYIAEAKWLRAYYYFDLVRLFKNVILTTEPLTPSNAFSQLQVAPAEVYKQIEKDLSEAIDDLPPTVPSVSEGGRITRGACKALLGKVILYQNENSRMIEAANLFEDINKPGNIYNYSLVSNYADIFSPANKFNSEAVFEIVHTAAAKQGWDAWGRFEGNVGVQMVGMRSFTGSTYEVGWGFNPVTTQLKNALYGDPRYNATIINADSLKAINAISYEASYQNTGFFVKKYAPQTQFKSNAGGDPVLNYAYDYIEIRLADTYLMEAEALVRGGGDVTKAAFYLNAVRARVGLPTIAATLDNIYNERRLELATEGHRFFDLVRTGKAATALSFKGFVTGKHEILPIPLGELNNTKLVQNPNYN